MKTLELKQMEQIEGGQVATCGLAAVGALGLGLAIAAITFPISALAFVGFLVSGFATGGSIGACAYEIANQ